MTTDAEQRDTFLSIREVLSNAAQRCLAAEAELQRLAEGGDDRLALASRKISQSERKLVGVLNDFASNAPEKLLHTRIQYLPDSSEQSQSEAPEEALANLVNVNRELTEILGTLADKLPTPESQDAVKQLRQEVETLAQHISMTSVTTHDH